MLEFGQVVTRIAASTESRMVGEDQLPMRLKELGQWPTLEAYLENHRKQYIEMVLHACRGDRSEAARVLGVDVSTLG
jgi:DNA-binding NtrC family response regulator